MSWTKPLQWALGLKQPNVKGKGASEFEWWHLIESICIIDQVGFANKMPTLCMFILVDKTMMWRWYSFIPWLLEQTSASFPRLRSFLMANYFTMNIDTILTKYVRYEEVCTSLSINFGRNNPRQSKHQHTSSNSQSLVNIDNVCLPCT